jgi:hypothetical protein
MTRASARLTCLGQSEGSVKLFKDILGLLRPLSEAQPGEVRKLFFGVALWRREHQRWLGFCLSPGFAGLFAPVNL